MKNEVLKQFLTNTDETGRFIVTSQRTGKQYFVEPTFPRHFDKRAWGSIDPASGELMHKKGDGKYTGAIQPHDSLITEDNGFKNIITLDVGTSPLHAIEVLDAKYPDKQ